MASRPATAAVLLLLVATVGAVSSGTAIETYTIDDNHALASSSAVDRYDSEGQVSTSIAAPNVTIGIAEEHEAVGVDATRADAPYHYLRIKYDETLPAVIRIHVPAGYWHPQPQNVESIKDEAEAKLRPSENADVTVVTVRFDGRTDAVFPVPKTASWVFATRDASSELVENRTDIEIPSLGSKSEWHYIERSRLEGSNATVKIYEKEGLTIQYRVSESSDRWVSVPGCTSSKGDATAVCRFERDGVDEYVFLLLRTEDPPSIRYKADPGPFEQVRSIGDGIAVSIENLRDMVSGWLGV